MNLLILHSAYSNASPSGENSVVENETRMLRIKGHKIFSPNLSASNPNILWIIILLKNFFLRKYLPRNLYNYSSRNYLKKNQIELIHCHNVFPLVDFSILNAACQLNIPIIFSIHNYRFLCLNGLFFRDNQVCTLCIDSNRFGRKFKCYKNSWVLSILAAKSQTLYLEYLRRASRILVLNSTTRRMLIDQGIMNDKIVYKKNFTEDRYREKSKIVKSNKNVIWVGRIDDSKGLGNLIESWNKSQLPNLGYRLKVVGDGPLREQFELSQLNNPTINFLGSKSKLELDELYAESSFLLVSSRWLEGFPMVIVEAAMHNLKVLAPKFGSFLDLEPQTWVTLVGNNIAEWVKALNQIPTSTLTNDSRKWYLENCTDDIVLSKLIEVYKDSAF